VYVVAPCTSRGYPTFARGITHFNEEHGDFKVCILVFVVNIDEIMSI
jgi:hypothetical protein